MTRERREAHLAIDRLVLDGFSAGERRRIQDAIVARLHGLLHADKLPGGRDGPLALPGVELAIGPGVGIETIADRVAAAVHGASQQQTGGDA